MALGSTQPLTEMSTRKCFLRVKAVGAYGLQPYHLHVPIVLKSGSLTLLEPSGPVQACNGIVIKICRRICVESTDRMSHPSVKYGLHCASFYEYHIYTTHFWGNFL